MSEHTDTPYHLCWSTQQYEDFGAELGFDFEKRDFQRAPSNDRVLGTRRYMPEEDAPIELGLPPGVLVRCHLVPTIGIDSPMLDVALEDLISRTDSDLSVLAEQALKENAVLTLTSDCSDAAVMQVP